MKWYTDTKKVANTKKKQNTSYVEVFTICMDMFEIQNWRTICGTLILNGFGRKFHINVKYIRVQIVKSLDIICKIMYYVGVHVKAAAL